MLKRTTEPLRRRVLVEEGKVKLKALKSSTRRTQTSGIFVKQVVFHTVNHRGPLPLKELHSTGETIVWRDPGGSWACLPPVYKCNHTATVCNICELWPKQHTKKRGALGNTKKTKITRRGARIWVEEVYEKDPKGSIQNEMLNRAKPLSNNNSWAEEGQEKPKNDPVKSERSPTKTILRTVIQNAQKNNKTTMKKSSDRRRPS